MARALRIAFEGAWYHVMNRGAGRKAIFRHDGHRRLFLALLRETVEMFRVELHAYCLMANHYHLLVHTPEGNLSRAMHHLNGVYTQRYNRQERTDGALFRGRYRAILIDADRYLLAVSRYIHLNPVGAGIAPAPARYPWSSYRAYIGQARPPPWLQTSKTLAMIGQRALRKRYRAFVEAGVDEEIERFYRQAKQFPILGSERFKRDIARRLSKRAMPASAAQEVPEARQLRPVLSLDQITATVARVSRVPVAALLRSQRGRRGMTSSLSLIDWQLNIFKRNFSITPGKSCDT